MLPHRISLPTIALGLDGEARPTSGPGFRSPEQTLTYEVSGCSRYGTYTVRRTERAPMYFEATTVAIPQPYGTGVDMNIMTPLS